MKHVIRTDSGPTPRGAYSQGWRAGDFIFVSGQVPRDPLTGEIVQGSLYQSAVRTLHNVAAVLEAAGASLRDVIKFTVIVQDLADIAGLNEAFETLLSPPLPARTTFQGGLMGVPLEIDAIAYVGPSPSV